MTALELPLRFQTLFSNTCKQHTLLFPSSLFYLSLISFPSYFLSFSPPTLLSIQYLLSTYLPDTILIPGNTAMKTKFLAIWCLCFIIYNFCFVLFTRVILKKKKKERGMEHTKRCFRYRMAREGHSPKRNQWRKTVNEMDQPPHEYLGGAYSRKREEQLKSLKAPLCLSCCLHPLSLSLSLSESWFCSMQHCV